MIRFDHPVPDGGYAWWYLDAISDDGSQALTLIAFIGSVFSPYYHRAITRNRGIAEQFCAINLALYRPRTNRWAMTERNRVTRSTTHLQIGPSSLHWTGAALEAEINEITAPIPHRLRGTLRLTPAAIETDSYPLDAQRNHLWSPIAPCARIEITFEHPALRWSGPAYLDHNHGAEPIANAFRTWHWSRLTTPTGTSICYDANRRDNSTHSLALHFARTGGVTHFAPPPLAALGRTLWRLPRQIRADPGTHPTELKRLEDAPFYARAIIQNRLAGQSGDCIHETLDLNRLRQPIIRAMLPFRMPRFR